MFGQEFESPRLHTEPVPCPTDIGQAGNPVASTFKFVLNGHKIFLVSVFVY